MNNDELTFKEFSGGSSIEILKRPNHLMLRASGMGKTLFLDRYSDGLMDGYLTSTYLTKSNRQGQFIASLNCVYDPKQFDRFQADLTERLKKHAETVTTINL